MQQIAVGLRDALGVAHVVYHWVATSGEMNLGTIPDQTRISERSSIDGYRVDGYRGQHFGCGTYDPEWVSHYLEKGYLRIDPVILGCYQRFHPVDWRQLDWSNKAARALAADAAAFGIGTQGYSIPLRGPKGQFALFSVSASCDDAQWDAFISDKRRDLILIAHYINQKALELQPDTEAEPLQPLSPRELEVMTLLALGYSRAQAANTLSISEHTFRVYVESARYKLGAQNTTHAVARALSRGLIVV
ncbi:MAG: LuxR family transcriptional regulator [Rhodobacteraceae bacterium]|nr:MAG: LuxR family transcriptional regulator [Paracoccaceae bacterium]